MPSTPLWCAIWIYTFPSSLTTPPIQMCSLWKLKQAKFPSKSISLFLSKDHLNSSHVSLEALCCWKIGQKRAGWQLWTTVEINSQPFSGLLGLIIWETYFQPSFKNWLAQSIPRIQLGSHHEKNWETQIEYFIDFVAKHFPFLDHYPFVQVKRALHPFEDYLGSACAIMV